MSRTHPPLPLLQEILNHIRWLHARDFLWAGEGNFSVREGSGFWITPSGKEKHRLLPEDFIRVPLEGPVPPGVSSEWPFHREIYRRTAVDVIYHAHPPYTVAASTVLPSVYPPVVEEVRLLEGPLAVVEGPTGSQQLAEAIARVFTQGFRVAILRNHGVVTAGSTPEEAFHRMQRVEREFQILTFRKLWTLFPRLFATPPTPPPESHTPPSSPER